jgi:AAA ATPase domain
VGREEELAGLGEFFLGRARRPSPVVRVLTGLGGIGKTSLARAYCARYQRHYGLVWWVRAGNADALATEFRGLLEILAPQDADRVTEPIQAVQAVLANRDQPWLLVVDNIASPQNLRGLLPASGTGDVIVTSRASGWPDQRAVLPVLPLDEESAVQLLTSVSGDPDRAAAAAVAHELGNLPLALAQAASYVAQADLDMADYLVLYRRRRAEMHREGHAPDYDEQVATTWQLAFDRLTSPARALLNLLCWYAPDAIPLDRLFADHAVDLDLPSTVASEVQPLVADELCRYSAIVGLAAYSLVTRAGVRGSVNVHRLVQAVTADSLKAQGTDESWVSAAAALLHAACPDPPADATTLASWGSLQTHVRALSAHLDPTQPISLSLRGCLAEWTELTGDARGAAQQYAPLVEDTQRVRGPAHRDSLIARRHLARCLGDSGEVTRARDMLEVLVKDTEHALGPLDEETLKVRGELARYTAECGSTTAARRLAHDLLQDMQPALGPDHPETLRTRGDLARLTGETGDAAKALELYVALVEDRLRILGAATPIP